MIAFAAKTLTASLLSVLNSASPIFGAIISAVWLRNRITKVFAAGLVMEVIGVIILVQGGIATRADDWGMPVAAALLSTVFYGIAGTYVKASPKPIEPLSNAHGSMWAATVLMVLTLPFYPAATEADPWGLDCGGGSTKPCGASTLRPCWRSGRRPRQSRQTTRSPPTPTTSPCSRPPAWTIGAVGDQFPVTASFLNPEPSLPE